MANLKAALLYFATVFGAGFILGPIRVTWLVPRVGERAAELIELPFMLVVIVAAARWVVRRFRVAPATLDRLTVGGIALALILAAEFGFVLQLRGLSPGQYLADRDPVSGTAYYLALGLFALMPLLVRRR
jgi:hypothetical protein